MKVDPEKIERVIAAWRSDMSPEGVTRRLRRVGDLVELTRGLRAAGRAAEEGWAREQEPPSTSGSEAGPSRSTAPGESGAGVDRIA